MLQAIACAKVNLSLRVGARQEDGLHQLDGVFQSISWVDQLEVHTEPDSDQLYSRTGTGAEGVIDGWNNLAWRALSAARDEVGVNAPMALQLDKQVPAAAGLGGGSGDAAAALAMGGQIFGVPQQRLLDMAVSLGSDVPFCLTGGTARVSGTGEQLEPLAPLSGFSIALVVPPIELSTGAVYTMWDRLEGPAGPVVGGRDLPPALRHLESLANDLYPAAAATAPALEDWRAELAGSWGRPVLLTGSGPTLFAFFIDRAEADDALKATPIGARAATAAVPVPFGWAIRDDDGVVEASTPVTQAVSALVDGLWF